MSHDTKAFGRLFREFRQDAGRSMGETARHLGISVTYLSDIERGTRAPLTRVRLLQACEWLKADPEALMVAKGLWHRFYGLPEASEQHNLTASRLVLAWEGLTLEQLDALERVLNPGT